MGKVKQGKRLSAHRTSGDPIGAKIPLAEEIESLKLAKSKPNDPDTKNNVAIRKRQADEDEVGFLTLLFFFTNGVLLDNKVKHRNYLV